MSHDRAFMERALLLAARGRGLTSPNPMVGAVIVAGGEVVGQGFHQRAGGPHAEVLALQAAGVAARGATLYCTLEPCCHHGRTGPCVVPIVAAGVRRVVAATEDPNPLVSGGGIRYLREHGLEVEVGPCAEAARSLNAPFFTACRLGRPHVTAKVALSSDAGVARADRRPVRLTSAPLDRLMQRQRAEVDALAVGVGTLEADDPQLTVREVYRERPLTRVVFDPRLRGSPSARVFTTRAFGPVLVATSESQLAAQPSRAEALWRAGAEILATPTGSLEETLRVLAARGVQSLLLEGGPRLHRAAFEAGVIDRVQLLVAPMALGPGRLPWIGVDELSLADLRGLRTSVVGPDVLIEGDVHRTH